MNAGFYIFSGRRISPDGKYVAHQSDESGKGKIYVGPFPDVNSGGRWQVSKGGGNSPQ
jgi:hypothetical protein